MMIPPRPASLPHRTGCVVGAMGGTAANAAARRTCNRTTVPRAAHRGSALPFGSQARRAGVMVLGGRQEATDVPRPGTRRASLAGGNRQYSSGVLARDLGSREPTLCSGTVMRTRSTQLQARGRARDVLQRILLRQFSGLLCCPSLFCDDARESPDESTQCFRRALLDQGQGAGVVGSHTLGRGPTVRVRRAHSPPARRRRDDRHFIVGVGCALIHCVLQSSCPTRAHILFTIVHLARPTTWPPPAIATGPVPGPTDPPRARGPPRPGARSAAAATARRAPSPLGPTET